MNMLLTILLNAHGGGDDTFALITPNPGMAIWTLIIFLILLFILGKFAFKPIANALKDRDKTIEESLNQAEKARAEMAQLTSKNEQLLEEAKEERNKILAEARELGEKLKADLIEKAKVEADKKVVDAVREIEIQKKAAVVEVKNIVGQMALNIASQIIKKDLSSDAAHKELVEKLVKDTQLN